MTTSCIRGCHLLTVTAVVTARSGGGGLRQVVVAFGRSSARPVPVHALGRRQREHVRGGGLRTLKGVCGPGTPKGPTARGLTDSTIRIGVNSDAGQRPRLRASSRSSSTPARPSRSGATRPAVSTAARSSSTSGTRSSSTSARRRPTPARRTSCWSAGGNALDDAGVKPREACKLGTIPAYTVTTAAANAGLQVKIQPGIATQVPFGAYRLLAQTYPDLKTKGIGIGSATLASLDRRWEEAAVRARAQRLQGDRACR